MQVENRVKKFKEDFDILKSEVGRMIVGQEEIIEGVITCLLAEGNALLEGVPGLGKTLLVRTLSQALDLKFSRIQFTPDLMPADIVGTNILVEDDTGKKSFQFQPGPVFANIILADEINRATPKTQSAMLEAMQEHSVTVAGSIRKLEEPFLVLATQNPIEMEGTYPLPEAQLDRFLYKLMVKFPTLDELGTILDRTTMPERVDISKVTDPETVLEMRRLAREVALADHVKDYALRTVIATHPDSEHTTEMVKRFVRYGSSPRGAQAIVLTAKVSALLDGRYNVSFDDIRKVALPALRHRIILNFEGEAEGIATDAIVQDILEKSTSEENLGLRI
ncbi:MAG: MoxR family ATPase [Armatimonadota bacterium]